jgi:tetratricopeptide (TPR) repeat protein
MRHVALAVLLIVAAGLFAAAEADQTDERLPGLFDRLKSSGSDDEARTVETSIWQIWSAGPDREADTLMLRGLRAMSEDHQDQALSVFNEMVQLKPDFAEGWNKRATVYFLMGDFESSVADIERTLALEPHHFGALSGLGQIYLALDRKEAALKAFEAALAIDPHLIGAKAAVRSIKKQLEGDPT